MLVLLLSTYELGRQPFGLASPAAWLREAGLDVRAVDLTREPLAEPAVREAGLVAIYLPMHTATRLALPVVDRVRRLRPDVHICAYGLYAPLNASLLRAHGVETILGGEFEAELAELASGISTQSTPSTQSTQSKDSSAVSAVSALNRGARSVPRLAFRIPDRSGLPPLARYATLQMPDGERRLVGYTEASRGCRHLCRHCPIVPVYEGRFRIVPAGVVLADVRAQVAAGACHITFGDPDFLNGPRHARAIVERLARECPGVTYDVTIKVEHLLQQAALLPVLRDTGCLFVTSAVESFDDEVLARLRKGHTRSDVSRAVALVRDVGLGFNPTFVAFTPWTSLDGYVELLDAIEELDLVESVASIQLALRLLVTAGSRLLELDDVRRMVSAFDERSLVHPWTHPDPRVDAFQCEVGNLVARRLNAPRSEVFADVWALARRRAGRPAAASPAPALPRAAVPYVNEPWYC